MMKRKEALWSRAAAAHGAKKGETGTKRKTRNIRAF
jgi:hypothetical protein